MQPNNLRHIVLLSSNINNVHLTVNALENYVSIELSFPEIFFFRVENFPFSVSAERQFFSPPISILSVYLIFNFKVTAIFPSKKRC